MMLVFILPDSFHQVQSLDLCNFGVAQTLIDRLSKLEKMNVQTAHIVQLAKTVIVAVTSSTIVPTFRSAGISLVADPIDELRDDQRKPYPICTDTPETYRPAFILRFGIDELRELELSSEGDVTFVPGEEEEDQEGYDPNAEEFMRRIGMKRAGESSSDTTNRGAVPVAFVCRAKMTGDNYRAE
jgi:hypothetical protein